MKFIKFLTDKRQSMLWIFTVPAIVAIFNIYLHDSKPTEFFLMIWVGLFLAAIGYTYYEFKNLDKNDWI